MRIGVILGSAAIAMFAFGLLTQAGIPVQGPAIHPSTFGTHGAATPTRSLENHGATSLPGATQGQFARSSSLTDPTGSSSPGFSSDPTQSAGNPSMGPSGSMMGSTHCVMHAKMGSVNLSLH